MSRTITIDPITRIEGHARIHVYLDEQGFPADAEFQVTQFRGFERLCQGRPFYEMPTLMARICGICPVSHLVASAKACDAILAVRVPRTGARLRAIMNLGQILQSHALSVVYLSAPDLLLGMDAPPEERNLVGVLAKNPELARSGVELRAFGQKLIEALGGKRVHPGWIVPGGVQSPLDPELRERLLGELPGVLDKVQRLLHWLMVETGRFDDEIQTFANFPSLFLGLVGEAGELEFYDGMLRVRDAGGRDVLGGDIPPETFEELLAERVEPHSFLKSTYLRGLGYPDGIYRVGPLARLNVVEGCGTRRADEALAELRARGPGPMTSSFYYHQARVIEMLHCAERLSELLSDPEILDPRVRAHAGPNAQVGVGVSEAPRGTLMHCYTIDDDGLVQDANLVIATGHNNLAMSRGVLQVARRFIEGGDVSEGALNRIEAVIRCFDPCLSCSTHAVGQMPLAVHVHDHQGKLVDAIVRDASGGTVRAG